MIRLGLVVVVVGVVLYALARPSRRGGEAPLERSWRQRGLRVALIGFVVLWVGVLVAIGALR